MCDKVKLTCPSCKGKGHVMDIGGLFCPIIGWAIMFFERNDPNGLSRDRCGQCKGKGYVER